MGTLYKTKLTISRSDLSYLKSSYIIALFPVIKVVSSLLWKDYFLKSEKITHQQLMLFFFLFSSRLQKKPTQTLPPRIKINKTFTPTNCLQGKKNLPSCFKPSHLAQLQLKWTQLEGQPYGKGTVVKLFFTGLGIN